MRIHTFEETFYPMTPLGIKYAEEYEKRLKDQGAFISRREDTAYIIIKAVYRFDVKEEEEMPPKDKEKINEIENSPLQIISFERVEEKRDCETCCHYVKQNEGNTEALFGELYGCELWDCDYKRKEEEK